MNVELKTISFNYKGIGGEEGESSFALSGINLTIRESEIIGIVGASGSGKTTLIQLMNGLLEPNLGCVLVNGEVATYKGEFALNWRSRVGMVFQFPEIQFFENSVYDEISFGLRNRHVPENAIRTRIEDALQELQMADINAKKQSPFQLSEGQKRRIAIASVLALNPEVLILDEPTAGLDHKGAQIVRAIIDKFASENRTVVIASHDMDFVHGAAKRIICLSGGKILFDGPKNDFFDRDDLIAKSNLELPRILKIERLSRRQDKDVKVASPRGLLDGLNKDISGFLRQG